MSEQRVFRFVVEQTPEEMGHVAAEDAVELLELYTRELKRPVLAVFAAAPSQDTFLQALVDRRESVDWSRITAFHLDEYLTLPRDHPNTFKSYLTEHLFDHVPVPTDQVHFIKDTPDGTNDVASWYGAKFAQALSQLRTAGGLYVVFLGVGVNGHIAFNEPNTQLDSPAPFLEIQLDETSIKQQYDDYKDHPDPAARYKSVDDVPRSALSISVSAILEADQLYCMVPGAQKAEAIRGVMDGAVTDQVPASLLRTHGNAALYVDQAAAALLRPRPASALSGGES